MTTHTHTDKHATGDIRHTILHAITHFNHLISTASTPHYKAEIKSIINVLDEMLAALRHGSDRKTLSKWWAMLDTHTRHIVTRDAHDKDAFIAYVSNTEHVAEAEKPIEVTFKELQVPDVKSIKVDDATGGVDEVDNEFRTPTEVLTAVQGTITDLENERQFTSHLTQPIDNTEILMLFGELVELLKQNNHDGKVRATVLVQALPSVYRVKLPPELWVYLSIDPKTSARSVTPIAITTGNKS